MRGVRRRDVVERQEQARDELQREKECDDARRRSCPGPGSARRLIREVFEDEAESRPARRRVSVKSFVTARRVLLAHPLAGDPDCVGGCAASLYSISSVSPLVRVGSRARSLCAGPASRAPSASKTLSWHGQRNFRCPPSHSTSQPSCGQTAETTRRPAPGRTKTECPRGVTLQPARCSTVTSRSRGSAPPSSEVLATGSQLPDSPPLTPTSP